MSEYKIIYEKLKIKPIMMLDDIFDKLDNKRINHFMKYITEKIDGQIFITDALQNRLKIIGKKEWYNKLK